MEHYILHFSKNDHSISLPAEQLGNKGRGLMQMTRLGVPVPAGFIISIAACHYYHEHGSLPPGFTDNLHNSIDMLEKVMGKKFGGSVNPLLLAVRSGANVSMPGMMDSILNVGLNDPIIEDAVGSCRAFATENYCRLLRQFIKSSDEASDTNDRCHTNSVDELKKIFYRVTAQEFPQDPFEQLIYSIEKVIKSWMSKRAIAYRKAQNIDDQLGTAIIVQSMVFGNYNDQSATGVVFTRNPLSGNKGLYGEFLIKAQGEDIVSGTHTPADIAGLQPWNSIVFAGLKAICDKLERHYKCIQDIEFTIEDGQLYILQTRAAKQTAAAQLKSSIALVSDQIISKEQAINNIEVAKISELFHSTLRVSGLPLLARGLAASPGAAVGRVVFSAENAIRLAESEPVILMRYETSPDDIAGLYAAAGFVTARGGITSHVAVVARGIGKPCVCGINELVIDEHNDRAFIRDVMLTAGDYLSIDGGSGEVFLGAGEIDIAESSQGIEVIGTWATAISKVQVRANAETVQDARLAMQMNATGIGLCRTEHMLLTEPQLTLIRDIIITDDPLRCHKALESLEYLYTADFVRLFDVMQGLPLNIRLLDPPLHEFLPDHKTEQSQLADKLAIPLAALEHKLIAMHETNPMLGLRGSRLGITNPEIYTMQLRAIFSAAAASQISTGIGAKLEIMLPFISSVPELESLTALVRSTADQMRRERDITIEFKLGTMIELPRAAIMADQFAPLVDFFSFGTNDLTQMMYGISRDDAAKFLPQYLAQGLIAHDPFAVLDQQGVGRLIEHSIKISRAANPALTYGVCGEQAADPSSIAFLDSIGVNYVSCSPYRICAAQIAAAQSTLKI